MMHSTKLSCDTRTELDHARQRHLQAFHAAIAGGTPSDELAHDLGAFCSAAVQLFTISAQPKADVRTVRRGAP